jgi:hypothetical protein
MQKRKILVAAAAVLVLAVGVLWWRLRGESQVVACHWRRRAGALAKVASLIRDRIIEICDCEGRAVSKATCWRGSMIAKSRRN